MRQGIFIGIGGSGVKSLARLKAKIYETYPDKKEFNNQNSFIFIDTDINDIAKIQSDSDLTRMYGGRQIIDLNEFIPIGSTNPYNVRQNAITNKDKSGSHLKTWMILHGEGKYTPLQTSLTDGAGAMRMDGRTTIFRFAETHIIPAIERAIQKMKAVRPDLEGKDTKDVANAGIAPNLWLISGSNGGTGSSMTLDVLFIMDRLYQKYLKSAPTIRLALLTPQPYVNMIQNRGLAQYPLNSFSFMWELNALKMNADKEGLMSKLFVNHYFDKDEDKNLTPFDPYAYVLAFDIETNLGASLDISDTFENVAKVLYLLSTTSAGGSVNSHMSNRLADTTIEPSRPTGKGTLLDNTEWSKSIVATGGKAIEKPNADFKNYLKTRFLYDVFAYGILGPEFNEVHNDAEKAETVKYIIKDNILIYLDNSLQVSEKPNLERDIISALINVTMSPEPEKGFRSYKEDGILSTYSNNFCTGIEEELILFGQSFEKPGLLINSKESYLNEIKETIRKTLNNLVCEHGLNYVKGLVYSIDLELEKNVIPNLNKTIGEEYSIELEAALKSEIDKISISNKEYASLVVASEKWKEFKLNKFIIQLKAKILLSLCKEGYFDVLLSANGNSKGIGPLITKFSEQKNILETDFLNLAKSFLSKSSENPFVTYFPPLSEMIGGAGSQSGWKRNSEFENLYSSMVSLNKDEKNIKGSDMMGTPPARSKKSGKDKSLEFHFEELLKLMGEYNGSYFIDFAEQNDFDRGAKSVASFMKVAEEYLDKLIIQTDPVIDWLNKNDLGQIFKRFEESSDDNKKIATSFKARFNNIPVFYPSDAIVSSVYYIYSFPDELLDFAKSIGYDPDDKQKFHNPTTNSSKLEVLAFETGHSFDTYSHFKNYANTYQEKRKGILALEYGCHIHKGFVHLDLDKALSNAGFQVGEPILLEIAFYDVVLELLKLKNSSIFNQLFTNTEIVDDGWGIPDGQTLPLLNLNNSNGIIEYKVLTFDDSARKLKIEKAKQDTLAKTDYTSFYNSSITLNKELNSIKDNLKKILDLYKNLIGGSIKTLIADNVSDLRTGLASKLSFPPTEHRSLMDQNFIQELQGKLKDILEKNVLNND